MSDMSLLPVGDGIGGEAVAAGFGGFVGSLFGNWFSPTKTEYAPFDVV